MPAAWLWAGGGRARRSTSSELSPEQDIEEIPVLGEIRQRCAALEQGLEEGERRRSALQEALEAERAERQREVGALKAQLAESHVSLSQLEEVRRLLDHLVAAVRELQAAEPKATEVARMTDALRAALDDGWTRVGAEASAATVEDAPVSTNYSSAADDDGEEEPAAEAPTADCCGLGADASTAASSSTLLVVEGSEPEVAGLETMTASGSAECAEAEAEPMPSMATPRYFAAADPEEAEVEPLPSSTPQAVARPEATMAPLRSVPASQARLLLSVTCETNPGFHVRVVGNHEDLGAWDPSLGLVLGTSPAIYPSWCCERGVPIKAHAQLEYKYVICSEDLSSVFWEECENRCVVVASAGACTALADAFGSPEGSASEAFDSEPPKWVLSRWPKEFSRSAGAAADLPLHEPEQEQDCLSDHTPKTCLPEDPHSPLREVSLDLDAGGGADEAQAAADAAAEDDDVEVHEAEAPSQPRPASVVPGPMCARRYHVLGDRPIGEGSFGFVWRCAREHCDDVFAVKLISRSCLLPRDVANLLGPKGEVRTHQALYHENIVRFLEHFDECETISLIMECCLGGDLYEAVEASRRVSGRGLSEAATSVVMRHTLSALAYLHRLCIAHRDVKAENVLLSKAGVPHEQNVFKLCDFGFAAHDDGHGHGLVGGIGSPFTVAPEVVTGKTYGCPSDIWSAGVLMYVTLSASLPFDGNTQKEVLRKVALASYSTEGALWDALPAPCKGFLSLLLSKSPDVRPTAAKALRHVWLSMLA